MREISSAVSGLLFGLGLAISGLLNPAKILNFLDIAGTWDPSLIFTMAGAIPVTMFGYRLALNRPAPLCDDVFHLPVKTVIDAPLLGGAAVFGLGWGLAGYCPGPAVAALGTGSTTNALFVAAMLAGMALARALSHRRSA